MKYFSDEYLAAAAKAPRLKPYSETFKENYLKRRAARMQKQYVADLLPVIAKQYGIKKAFYKGEA